MQVHRSPWRELGWRGWWEQPEAANHRCWNGWNHIRFRHHCQGLRSGAELAVGWGSGFAFSVCHSRLWVTKQQLCASRRCFLLIRFV